MNSRRIPLLVFLATLFAATTYAQTPMKSPKLAELQYFVGNWDCTGTTFAIADVPTHPTKAKAKGSWTLGGQWLALTYDEMKDAKNTQPIMARMFLGYDSEKKQIVSGSLDNMGGYSTSGTDGWSNSMLTLEGPLHSGGMTAKSRETFTMKSKTELMHSSSIEVDGKWQKLDEETCWKK
jgi:hypothetical protein